MLPVFLPLIGVQDIRAFRFNAAKVDRFANDASLSPGAGIGHRRLQGVAQQGSRSGTCGCPREKYRAARGSVFSNELRTTRSTLKHAFSSRNVSIFVW